MIVKLTADVSCEQPSWASTYTKLGKQDYRSIYRLYINDELFAERTWLWDNKTYVSEQIIIDADCNLFRFRLEPVQKIPEVGVYTVTNVHINDRAIPGNQGLDFQFTIE